MALRVLKPGMLTTVQDVGRWGQQQSGVPVAGPMDWYSHRLANQLVGNDDRAALLEITVLGPELEADADTTCVVTGAEFDLTAGDVELPHGVPFILAAGERLRFGNRRKGARAMLAVGGGFDVAQTFGSRATSLAARMGPFSGRPVMAGDVLPVGDSNTTSRRSGRPLAMPESGARVRVMRGPDDAAFSGSAYETLLHSRFIVTPESNRMGYRLAGLPIEVGAGEILSAATPMGSLQVPRSGHPILLMADRQTTGGYPRIATVITADLPIAGQLAPGDWIEFDACTRADALEALRARAAGLTGQSR